VDTLKNYRPGQPIAEPAVAAQAIEPHRLAVAPMLDWTDRHCRYLLRLVSRHTLLYTEMVTTGAILHGRANALLRYHAQEHPLALQLGGSDPQQLAACARIGAEAGYDEINLNVGCPSDRVQSGRFGACLMAEPQLVADCVAAMQQVVAIPVTVKCRTGIDHDDSLGQLAEFIATIAATGCRRFIIHARKAWLSGLSPKQNRTVPPLQYDRVYLIKQEFPALDIVINGGITTLDAVQQHLQHVDGVMLGRAVYHDPWLLADADRLVFGDAHPVPSRLEIIEQMIPYIELELKSGAQLKHITRHMLGMFQGEAGARRWRRHLSDHAVRDAANTQVIHDALALMQATANYHETVTEHRTPYG
jgi:tRNA-dihydrouridine synthase A